jgi:hypothetical protein
MEERGKGGKTEINKEGKKERQGRKRGKNTKITQQTNTFLTTAHEKSRSYK